MATDPIMKEVHKIKDDIAREFDYDLDKLFQHLLQQQETNKAKGVKYASFPPKRPKKDEAA